MRHRRRVWWAMRIMARAPSEACAGPQYSKNMVEIYHMIKGLEHSNTAPLFHDIPDCALPWHGCAAPQELKRLIHESKKTHDAEGFFKTSNYVVGGATQQDWRENKTSGQ